MKRKFLLFSAAGGLALFAILLLPLVFRERTPGSAAQTPSREAPRDHALERSSQSANPRSSGNRGVAMPEMPPSIEEQWKVSSPVPALAAFQSWSAHYMSLPATARTAAVPEGIRLASERRAEFRSLIMRDPEQALASAVPESVRRAMPEEVRSLLEEKVDDRGDLVTTSMITKDVRVPAGRRATRTEAHLEDGRWLEAFVYGNREFQPSRQDVPVHGIAIDGMLAVSQWPGRVLERVERAEAKQALASAPVCPTSGKKTSETEAETALITGRDVAFYCSPLHATDVLRDAAEAEAVRPPGFGAGSRAVTLAASGGAGVPVPNFLNEGDPSWTTGTKRILVVPVKFKAESGSGYTDYTGLTLSDCETVVAKMRKAYADWSFGRLNVRLVETGGSRVSPFVNLAGRAIDYYDVYAGAAGTIRSLRDLWDEVEDKVEDEHGIDPDLFHFIVVLAGNAPIQDDPFSITTNEVVWWSGKAITGGRTSISRINDPAGTPQDRIDDNVWIALHEVGHNLGLHHSSTVYTAPRVSDGSTILGEEYGDLYDRMGSAGLDDDFNVRYKLWLQWLDNANVPYATTDGVYRIREHDLEEKSGVRGLQVAPEPGFDLTPGGELFFIEYRLDSVAAWTGYPYVPYKWQTEAWGAQIRSARSDGPKSWLLDATPETFNWSIDMPDGDVDQSGIYDSPLLPGRTFSRSRGGHTVYITNLAADPEAGELTVEIQHGPVPGNDPPAGSITVSTPQGAVIQNIAFTANVTDPEDSDLAYHWQIPGFSQGVVSPAVFPNTRSITVKFPNTGSRVILCLVSDKHGGTVPLSRSFSIVQNSPPSIGSISDRTTNEDVPLLNIPFTVSDPTTPAGSLVVTASSDNTSLFPAGSIVLGGSGGNRTIGLTPAANHHGEASIKLTVSDGSLVDLEFLTVTVNPVTPGTTLVASGGNWRYWDDDAAPAGNWTAAAYDDGRWDEAGARFVFPGLLFNPLGWTALADPSPNPRTTCYFRRDFFMPASPVGTPVIRFQCDDGLVVYINGVERWRHNIPAGSVGHNTRAASSVEGDDETGWIAIPLSITNFSAGATNTIAVEVHDAAGTRGGGDVVFDFQLQLLQTPAVSNITNKTSPEDTFAGPYNFTAAEAESPSGGLTFTAVSSNQSIVADAGIKTGTSPNGYSLTAMPQPNATGVTEITLKVGDGSSETWESFQLSITPVNDAPWITAVPDTGVALDEIPPLVELRIGDVDNDPAALTVTASASNAALLPASATQILPGITADRRWLRLSPVAGSAAQTNVTVNVSDGSASVSDVFLFRVNVPLSTTASDVRLVESGETWRYWAAALPLDPRGNPVDFTDPSVDDRAWPSGPSQLGYGGDGEATNLPVTPYRVTTYLRKKFFVPNAAAVTQLKLRMLRDDGAVVYLNGTRVWRNNMSGNGPYTGNTLAASDIAGVDEDSWLTATAGTSDLRSGTNTIAVELHQSAMPTSLQQGDLSFDFEVDGVPAAPNAPDVIVSPGESWSYWDQNSYPDETWKVATFTESGWKQGLARFGYGIGGESTVVNNGSPQRNPSVLFRKVFDIADPAAYTTLHLFVQRDDGIAVHLNGARVFTFNVSATSVPGDFANAEIPSPQQTQWHHYLLDPRRLIAGRNLLAVEVHQASPAGTDLNFDLQLTGELAGTPALFMRPAGTDTELSWSAAWNGWTLRSSTDLNAWNSVPAPTLHDAGWIYVQDPSPAPRKFYRLERP